MYAYLNFEWMVNMVKLGHFETIGEHNYRNFDFLASEEASLGSQY